MIEQLSDGYRFSIEPFLLADFADVSKVFRVLDIGTGSGIIPLLLSKKNSKLKVVAIEIQELLSDLAIKNVRLAGLSNMIEVVQGDFLKIAATFESKPFDIVLSNPPYRKLNSGRINPDPVKAIARHEIKLNFSSITEMAFKLLKPNGRIVLSYPVSRIDEVLTILNRSNLVPSRLRKVYGYPGALAKFFLVEAEKSRVASPVVEDAFFIYKPDGSYTENMERVYASFNYPSRSHRIGKKRSISRASG